MFARRYGFLIKAIYFQSILLIYHLLALHSWAINYLTSHGISKDRLNPLQIYKHPSVQLFEIFKSCNDLADLHSISRILFLLEIMTRLVFCTKYTVIETFNLLLDPEMLKYAINTFALYWVFIEAVIRVFVTSITKVLISVVGKRSVTARITS